MSLPLIKPKDFSLTDMDGNPISVILSRFPAMVGREISIKYPMSNLPKISDYQVSEETAQKLMKYVAIPQAAGVEPLRLTTRELIETHIPDSETLMKIEIAMLGYNFSFFQKGVISGFLNEYVQTIIGKIIGMLNPSSAASSEIKPQP